MGDEFFDFIGPEITTRLKDFRVVLSDLARLIWAKELLRTNNRLEKVVWLDADVFVFAPDLLSIDAENHFAVGRQNWIQWDKRQKLRAFRQVHNAILVLGRESFAADFLIESISRMICELSAKPAPQMFGPKLLTALHNVLGFHVVESVDMGSPLVLQDIINGGGKALQTFKQSGLDPLSALNLCGSYQDQVIDGVLVNNALLERAIEQLSTYGLPRQ